MRKRRRIGVAMRSRQVTHIRRATSTRINFDTSSRIKETLTEEEDIGMLKDTCKIELLFRVKNKEEAIA